MKFIITHSMITRRMIELQEMNSLNITELLVLNMIVMLISSVWLRVSGTSSSRFPHLISSDMQEVKMRLLTQETDTKKLTKRELHLEQVK
jgi:hypothetical protein